MAEGGRLLHGDDDVTDQLLSHVSRHVMSETRKPFAIRELRLDSAKYSHIEEDERCADDRGFEVS